MNFLVAVLLLHLDEDKAFWILAALVEDLLPSYYSKNIFGVHLDGRAFRRLLCERRLSLPSPFSLPFLHLLSLSLSLSLSLWSLAPFPLPYSTLPYRTPRLPRLATVR